MMRVFVTGATGFIGSAIVCELIEAGHEVLGLARSDESATKLIEWGATVQRGSLTDLDSLRQGVAATDGVIHAAFIHDFSDVTSAGEIDRLAIEAIGAELAGTNRPFVVTSVIGHLASDQLATEQSSPDQHSMTKHRSASEEVALSLSAQDVRVSVIRLPPSVHGEGDTGGFIPALIRVAQSKGISAYIGEGHNHWPAVHCLDAVRLYRLALEKAIAGSMLHAIGEEGIVLQDIATTIGQHLNVPVVSISATEAKEHFGWLAHFTSINIPASSRMTQQQLEWKPVHSTLLADLDGNIYFKTK